jgi:hypothetical protein
VVTDRDKNFARKMSAFLAAVELIFEMDTCGTVFSE